MAWDREFDSVKREWIGKGDPNLVGYFIRKGKVEEVKGEAKIMDLAREHDGYPTLVFWTREAAEEELARTTDPVGHTLARFRRHEISEMDVRQLLGDTVALPELAKVKRG